MTTKILPRAFKWFFCIYIDESLQYIEQIVSIVYYYIYQTLHTPPKKNMNSLWLEFIFIFTMLLICFFCVEIIVKICCQIFMLTFCLFHINDRIMLKLFPTRCATLNQNQRKINNVEETCKQQKDLKTILRSFRVVKHAFERFSDALSMQEQIFFKDLLAIYFFLLRCLFFSIF